MNMKLFVLLFSLVFASCSTVPIGVVGRYVAADGQTAIVLLPKGEARAEQLGEPHVFFAMGQWARVDGNVQIESLGEKLILEPVRNRASIMLHVKNLKECPQIRSALNISDRYVSDGRNTSGLDP